MSVIPELKIDEEFEVVIPPLDEEEFKNLKKNILSDGEIYYPIITWNGILIDGHYRYKVLKENPDIKFRISEKEFENRYDAMAWICQNQLGRRNLSNVQKIALMGKRYKAEKQSHGSQKRFAKKSSPSVQNEHLEETEKTAEKIAKEMNVSPMTVRRAEKFVDGMDAAEEVSPGITRAIISGEIKPTQKDVMAIAIAPAERRKELAQQLRENKKLSQDEKPKQQKTRDLRKSLDALDQTHLHPETNKVTPDDMLDSFSADVEKLIRAMNFYFKEFPEILTETRYRERVRETLKPLLKYIDKLEVKNETTL